ncbi:TfoX/Sxy family protein [Amylibacter sp. IMCC11727]|uniref:TfoX/Sxy family protein n=1 Tax=Amylibacter sp. IMCC11727 TaxID=3039851 RepID=UPI00244DFE7F|nr:TfoX/Sxy family protein [Amylibacter sp. IMCC11727]WGI20674.1 TfoX/Sxy family protein [Amylibacter sp. IMCC11727]
MAVSAEDIAYVTDLFSDLPAVTTRKMMGGLSIYSEGTIFAIWMGTGELEGTLMVKATDDLAQALENDGAIPFTYTNKKSGKTVTMPYWSLPDSALDDPESACDWARKSLIQNG